MKHVFTNGGRRGGGRRGKSRGVRAGGERGIRGRTDGSGRGKIYIYGKHALAEALANMPKVIRKVFLAPEARADETLRELLMKAGIAAETLRAPDAADRMVGEDTAHQGVVAIIDPSGMVHEFRDFARERLTLDWLHSPEASRTMLVLLDELNDPHNVGAIIRSAVAFGASGILIPSHNQAPITGAVVKASAGMAFRVPLISIGNVNQAIDELRQLGFLAYGLAMDGARVLSSAGSGSDGAAFDDAPALIVVGNEGKGIREKTLERCDITLRIPMDARAESLNASVSAAIVMYAWSAAQRDVDQSSER